MSGQQQVTDEGTRPDKSYNGASESEQNLTLLDRRGEGWWNTKTAEDEAFRNF